MDKKFIMVSSLKDADTLIKAGYWFLRHEGDYWLFLNNNKLTFSENIKAIYTDKLSI